MAKPILRPVFMVYPGLFPLLMFNYWVRKARIPVRGILISSYDIKIHGKILSFLEELVYFLRRSGWRYSLYMLLVAKWGIAMLRFWNKIRKFLGKPIVIKTFEDLAKEQGIPIFYSHDFNSQQTRNFLQNVNANIIISAYNNQILKPRVISFTEFGTINIHPGFLPDFRGLDAVFEAMYHGVRKAGPTIHFVTRGIDTGPILLQEKLLIHKTDTLFSLNVKIWMHGAKMLVRALEMIESQNFCVKKQNPMKAVYPYRSYPTKKRIKEFLKKGNKLFSLKDFRNLFR